MRIAIVTRPKPDKAGTLPLYLRATHGGVKRYVALSLRIPARDWNPRRQEVRAASPHAGLNRLLAERLAVATDAAHALTLEGRIFTANDLKDVVEAALHPVVVEPTPERRGVVAYGRDVQRDLDERGQVGSALVYGTTMRHLEGSLTALKGRPEATFAELDAPFLRAHQARLLSAPPRGLGHKPNYAAKQLRTLRAVLRRADEDEEPGATAAVRAFSALKVRTQKVEKARLTLEQVRAFESATFAGRAADVQDWWLFSFYAAGMRWGDLMALRWTQIERDGDGRPTFIRFVQRKTSDPLGTPIVAQAAAILDRWEPQTGAGGTRPSPFVFALATEHDLADPHRTRRIVSNRGALARKYLAAMSTGLDLPRINIHTARHSFADVLRESGASLYEISKSLGHKRLATTEAYLAGFDVGAVGDAMRKAFG